MKKHKWIPLLLVIAGLAFCREAFSYEAAFDKTEVGAIEVKTLPATRVLVATEPEGDYFSNRNELFMSLFNYIKRQKIKMTVPVQVQMNVGNMIFFLGKTYQGKEFPEEGNIRIAEMPKRTVIALGKRGGYSRENLAKANLELQHWMKNHPEYVPIGEAQVVFWNGPYVPGFLKRFEVHIPLMTEGRDAPCLPRAQGNVSGANSRGKRSSSPGHKS